MHALLAAINCAKGPIEVNLAGHLAVIDTADAGDLVLFPEMSLTGSVDPASEPDRLVPLEDPAVTTLAQAARSGVTLCFGIAERGPDGEPYITQLVAADGAAAAGAKLVLFPAAPGLHGRRTDEASWRSGFSWWQGCSLGDASRHAKRLGLWIAQAGQAGTTKDEDFPGLAALTGPDGQVVARLPDWRAGVLAVDVPAGSSA